jgi:hypothetical protein
VRGKPIAPPSLSTAKQSGGKHLFRWSAPRGEKVSLWIFQVKRGKEWTTEILPGTTLSKVVANCQGSTVALSAVSRFRAVSSPAIAKP